MQLIAEPKPSLLRTIANAALSLVQEEPHLAKSIEAFIDIVEQRALDSLVVITVRTYCLHDSNPRMGRAVGGIGNFSYYVECAATFTQPDSRVVHDEDDVSRHPQRGSGSHFPTLLGLNGIGAVIFREFVATRFGSLTGVSDSHQRSEKESLSLSAAQRIFDILCAAFGDNPQVTFNQI